MSKKTLNEILIDAGIEIIRPSDNPDDTKLKFNNKEIFRGYAIDCYTRVYREFGINLKNFE